MQNLRNPRWIFIINTLPIIVMITLYLGEFSIIKTLLSETNIELWKSFGFAITSLGILNFSYALYLIFKKQEIQVWYGLAALCFYIPFIYTFANYNTDIIPWDIPQWMVSDEISLYAGTFLMPTLAYALFLLVSHFTPQNKKSRAGMNLLFAAAIPVGWYLFYQILIPLWQPVDYRFSTHLMVIFSIISTLLFLFFLIRSVYILASKKGDFWKKHELVWKIPICILMPIAGLATNNGHFFGNSISNHAGLFGNFNSIWFFILALLNGILLCLPAIENFTYRLFLFVSRSITLAYTFYFFIVFLPFLPLSVLAIILVGTGFLMLTPLILFVIHIKQLFDDVAYLKVKLSKKFISAIVVISFLVIPTTLTVSFLKDKSVLKETLEYVYTPDYEKEYVIDTNSLNQTLDAIKQHKDRNTSWLSGSQTPYLSTFFKWLVLDNLTLSGTKISHIEQIFFGEISPEFENLSMTSENNLGKAVSITAISSQSIYNKDQDVWTSWIDLEITNTGENRLFSEYATVLNLPEGCFIKDYYLYVGDRKEMGILAEKKSAMWVFSQIRNENKDPGILYYLKGNKVAFRVFPFAENEVRKTGIQLLHKEPIEFTIDHNTVQLGDLNTLPPNIETASENAIYVSHTIKETLQKVERKPYYHFIMDASANAKTMKPELIKKLEKLISTNPKLSNKARISYTGSHVITQTLDNNWKGNYQSQGFSGGFYVDRALKKAMANQFFENSETYPIFVVVTDSMYDAILDTNYSDFKMAFPESGYFYYLNTRGELNPHSLMYDSAQELEIKVKFGNKVLKYVYGKDKTAYLPDDKKASIILKKPVFKTSLDEVGGDWSSALSLYSQWNSHILNPKQGEKEWLNLVQNSFVTKIMTPITSYLVVENEAQKAILKKKQGQVLSGNKSLDLDEDTPRMSEPSWYILLMFLMLFIAYRNKNTILNSWRQFKI